MNHLDPRMARVEGIDPKRTGSVMRYVFEKVRQTLGPRFNTAENRRSSAGRILGEGSYRMGVRREGESPAAIEGAGAAQDGGAHWVPVLNRRQLCRQQNVRVERQRDYCD